MISIRKIMIRLTLTILLATSLSSPANAWSDPGDRVAATQQLLRTFCIDCHDERTKKATFTLHDISPDIASGKDLERWEKVLEMVSIGDMPPKDESQPTKGQRDQLVNWLTQELKKIGRGPGKGEAATPRFGNRVDHDELFSGEHQGPAYTESRLWRISPQIYQRFASNIGMARKFNAPLQTTGGEGIRDYSLLYADEATIKTMLQNCKRAASSMIYGELRSGRKSDNNNGDISNGRTGTKHKAIADFIKADAAPDDREMRAVLDFAVGFLLQRKSTRADQQRYIEGFLKPNCKLAGREVALSGLLTTIMLSPEFLFRMELGLGEELPDGRRKLSPQEIAYALSFALFDYVDPKAIDAADRGDLSTKEDIAREFRRMLTEPDRAVRGAVGKHLWIVGKGAGITDAKLMEASYPRLLRFFREYFGYVHVQDVFKDDTRHDGRHDPFDLIQSADWFVLGILRDDQQVLTRLLTDDRYVLKTGNKRSTTFTAPVFNIDDATVKPVSPEGFRQAAMKMPDGQRAGMLTHPAWLAAHSGNFENDPVRRGKWIQEHLLAGVVPDIPIGVEARLPEEPHRTLRQRFEITRVEQCWRCHKKMNPLGEPFEAFDDFGRFRSHHLVDKESSHIIASKFEAYSRIRQVRWRDSHKKNAPPEAFETIPVDSSGMLVGTGDPKLDGKVAGPIDLVHRIARSDRARQSFIRYVFRYWMGRNETLNDSPTLLAMDQAYLKSNGSFKELLVTLVTSDSFLLRK